MDGQHQRDVTEPAAMQRAIYSVGPSNLEDAFWQGTVPRLDQIMKATRDAKTQRPPGFRGSSTFANAIAFLERGISKAPFAGGTVTGLVRGAVKVREMGQASRQVKEAQQTPLVEAILRVPKNAFAPGYAESLRQGSSAATATWPRDDR